MDNLHISAMASQHLGDSGPTVDACYQMLRIIERLLPNEDLSRFLAFFLAAYEPDPDARDSRLSAFREKKWRINRAAHEHLGEELSEEINAAWQMTSCIDVMLKPEQLFALTTFIRAAYGIHPSEDNAG